MNILNYWNSKETPYPAGEQIGAVMEHTCGQANVFSSHVLSKPKTWTNIAIYCRGSSGAIFAALFVNFLHHDLKGLAKIYHVKKPGENSHSEGVPVPPEGSLTIVIDDLICSGSTIRAIYAQMGNRPVDYLILACNTVYSPAQINEYTNFIPRNFIFPTS